MDQHKSLIFAPPSERERRIAMAVGFAAVAAVVLMAPFGKTPAFRSAPVVTLVYTTYVAAASITAWLLRSQYRSSGFVPLVVLATAHAYGAVIIAAYLLTFPHVFAPGGLLGAGPQTAAWLWVAAHAGLIALSFFYVSVERLYARAPKLAANKALTHGTVIAAAAAACLFIATAIGFRERLPVLVVGDVHYTPLLVRGIVPAFMMLYAAAFGAVVWLTRLRTVTNLWIGVTIVALFGELTAGAQISGGRFAWGWYLGHVEGAIAALTFLIVMLRQMQEVLVSFAISNRTLAERSERDHLTELLNRRGFEERIAGVFRHVRRTPTSVALLMVDVDHFKEYNDHFGHVCGDDALRAIGATIAAAVNRSKDSCCRIGGDEFAVVLPGTDHGGAAIVAERIRQAIAALGIRHAPGLEGATLTVSVGIASSGGDPSIDAQALHVRADAALYEAKRLGRNRTSAAPPVDSRSVARTFAVPRVS